MADDLVGEPAPLRGCELVGPAWTLRSARAPIEGALFYSPARFCLRPVRQSVPCLSERILLAWNLQPDLRGPLAKPSNDEKCESVNVVLVDPAASPLEGHELAQMSRDLSCRHGHKGDRRSASYAGPPHRTKSLTPACD